MIIKKTAPFGLIALLALTGAAEAHVTFENKEVAPGTTVKFVLRLPHGCSGASNDRAAHFPFRKN